MPLGDVVSIGHRLIGHEHEQMRPVGEHAFVQLAAGFAHRDRRHDPIQPAVEVIEILLQCGVVQRLAPPSDGDGAQQQPLERGAEGGIAAFDGVLCIT